mmetsp:Transcript_32346/g.90562  ORF Transcript_32346/g.90562 Transcript_32346/m.90562 type:complete len:111 (+) Transcript_32346:164-496(+)|eukprot:CAMPEP_0119155524 /NCGR_PEP_ID=MMETSP1310-20130426/51792_1 /TAXON_ID=464262 /ORGANISM="Genus nov. species nov., Strain RCC2339" /LENGTH=110 /DNA_ID=CAMNT_0007148123 /DNA_START=75 /DNA_END=407 /DNA_ORIENTATION=-
MKGAEREGRDPTRCWLGPVKTVNHKREKPMPRTLQGKDEGRGRLCYTDPGPALPDEEHLCEEGRKELDFANMLRQAAKVHQAKKKPMRRRSANGDLSEDVTNALKAMLVG